LRRASGDNPEGELHKPESMEIYSWCGEQLLNGLWSGQDHQPKDILVLGQHFPTSLITNFRDPQPYMPEDVEIEIRGKVVGDVGIKMRRKPVRRWHGEDEDHAAYQGKNWC